MGELVTPYELWHKNRAEGVKRLAGEALLVRLTDEPPPIFLSLDPKEARRQMRELAGTPVVTHVYALRVNIAEPWFLNVVWLRDSDGSEHIVDHIDRRRWE